jgi:catechol 2,3-dioxygenase-like lactoylglutathione lyase family enzyme
MLAANNAMATVAVKDLAQAKKFYGDTLGLEAVGMENGQVATYRSGNSTVVVYRSEFAGTNKATSATWGVGAELDSIVRSLKNAGVPFEHYDFPDMTREGDVHVFDDFKAAWFRDPDGNILHQQRLRMYRLRLRSAPWCAAARRGESRSATSLLSAAGTVR